MKILFRYAALFIIAHIRKLFFLCVIIYVVEWKYVESYLKREYETKTLRRKLLLLLDKLGKDDKVIYLSRTEADYYLLSYEREYYGVDPSEIDSIIKMILASRGFIFKWVLFICYLLNIYDDKFIYGVDSDPDNTFTNIKASTKEKDPLLLMAREALPNKFKDSNLTLHQALLEYKSSKEEKGIIKSPSNDAQLLPPTRTMKEEKSTAAVKRIVRLFIDKCRRRRGAATLGISQGGIRSLVNEVRKKTKEDELKEREDKERRLRDMSLRSNWKLDHFSLDIEEFENDIDSHKKALTWQNYQINELYNITIQDNFDSLVSRRFEVDNLIKEVELLIVNKSELMKSMTQSIERIKEQLSSNRIDVSRLESAINRERAIDSIDSEIQMLKSNMCEELTQKMIDDKSFRPNQVYYQKHYKYNPNPKGPKELYISIGTYYVDEMDGVVRPKAGFKQFEGLDAEQLFTNIEFDLAKAKKERINVEGLHNELFLLKQKSAVGLQELYKIEMARESVNKEIRSLRGACSGCEACLTCLKAMKFKIEGKLIELRKKMDK